MDQDLIHLIEENNQLLKENIELTQKNSKKINNIQSYMRRTFVAKVVYWIIIVLVTAGALYAAKPYVNSALETYQQVQEQIEATSGVISNPESLFKDVGILQTLFDKFKD